jgi:hypothetical protein
MDLLKQVENLISAKISVIKAVLTILRLEARLAGLSIVPLVLNLFMLFAVLISLWLSVSALLGYGILLIINNIPLTLVLMVLFHLGMFWVLAKYLTFNIKSMSFEKTRSYLFQNENTTNEHEKAIKGANSADGSNLTRTTN